MEHRKTEIIVGIFSLLALALLIGVTVNLKKSTLFTQKYPVYGLFKDAKRLEEGAPVNVHGVVRGEVQQIEATGQKDYPVRVKMMLSRGTELHEGAIARIVSAGLVGETEVNIIDSNPSAPALEPGAQLKGETFMDIDDLLARAPGLLESVEESVDAVAEILTNPRHQEALTTTLDSVSSISAQLNRTLGASSEDLVAAVHNIRLATDRLDRIMTRAESTLTTFGTDLTIAGAELRTTIQEIRTSAGTVLVQLDTTAQRVDEAAAKAGSVLDSAQSILAENRDDARQIVEGLTSASLSLSMILERIEQGSGALAEAILGAEPYRDLQASLRELNSSLEIMSKWLGGLDRWIRGRDVQTEPIDIPYQNGGGRGNE